MALITSFRDADMSAVYTKIKYNFKLRASNLYLQRYAESGSDKNISEQLSTVQSTLNAMFSGLDSELAALQAKLEEAESILPSSQVSSAQGSSANRAAQLSDSSSAESEESSSVESSSSVSSSEASSESVSSENTADSVSTVQVLSALAEGSDDETLGALEADIAAFASSASSMDTEQAAQSYTRLSGRIADLRASYAAQQSAVNQALTDSISQTAAMNSAISGIGAAYLSGDPAQIGLAVQSISALTSQIDSAKTQLSAYQTQIQDDVSEPAQSLSSSLTAVISKLSGISNALGDLDISDDFDEDELEDALDDMRHLSANAGNLSGKLITEIDDFLLPKSDEYLEKGSQFAEDMTWLLDKFSGDTDRLADFLQKVKKYGNYAIDDIEDVRVDWPDVEERVQDITDKLHDFEDDYDLKEVIERFGKNPETQGAFFSEPIEMDTHDLYPMSGYGASMAPFYTTLCLWIGAMIIPALFSTKAHNCLLPVSHRVEFLGKYLLFASIGVLQALAASLGDLWILGIDLTDPGLFVSECIFTSIVFTMIVFTLVSLLSNVGKALSILILVLQIAGAGGTFPIQVLPEFFQKIHRALPFTYAISAMREAAAGVAFETLKTDFLVLSAFFAAFLAIGLLCVRWVKPLMEKFSKKLQEANVLEH